MKRILLPNAHLSWIRAIRCADALSDGRATLQTKKEFVSSLHNSVELFAKQWLLDMCDYRVVAPKSVTKKNIDLYSRFFAATDLNGFFPSLTKEEQKTFYTIDFKDLKEIVKEMINPPSWNDAFTTLADLRNAETHFYIDPDDYLSESQFRTLYNFMIDFYNGIKNQKLLPICGWGEPFDDNERRYRFDRTPLSTNFSFKSVLRKSSVALLVKEKLENAVQYDDFSDDPAKLAAFLIEKCEFGTRIDYETLADYIEAMNRYGIIEYEAETDEIPTIGEYDNIVVIDEDHMQTIIIGYRIKVNIPTN